MVRIDSLEQLKSQAGSDQKVVIGFFGEFSEKSRNQLPVFKQFAQANPDAKVFIVDVRQAKEVHPHFGVTLVPTVILAKGDSVLATVVGERPISEYEALLNNAPTASRASDRPTKRVIVYSTTTCPWCTRLKDYLTRRGVPFKDIDVSRDQAAAQRMVAKSGQMGVPQCEINGQIVVGFDQNRIDMLLGLPRERMAQ